MASLPANTKVLLGVGEYGIDTRGELLYFTLKCRDSQNVSFAGTHRELADLIHHLQIIATKALEIRTSTAPEGTKTQHGQNNCELVQSGALCSDVSGQFATLMGKMENGEAITLQIGFDALEQIYAALPKLIAQMHEIREQQYATH